MRNCMGAEHPIRNCMGVEHPIRNCMGVEHFNRSCMEVETGGGEDGKVWSVYKTLYRISFPRLTYKSGIFQLVNVSSVRVSWDLSGENSYTSHDKVREGGGGGLLLFYHYLPQPVNPNNLRIFGIGKYWNRKWAERFWTISSSQSNKISDSFRGSW